MIENSIVVRNLKKTYGSFCLENINLEVPTGCIIGFIGENGAGKTTTIKSILGLVKKESGEIEIFGKKLKESSRKEREKIGVVFDENHIPENLNAIECGKVMGKIYQNWEEKVYIDYLERFSLPLKKEIKEYSRGMKMKLNIAIALSHKTKILILDEATSGLDPIVREEVLDLFQEFIQEEDHSILMSSHITSDLEKIADYIIYIHKGQIQFCMQKDELLHNYGILKCSKEDFIKIDKKNVVGSRENAYGVEALIIKSKELDKYIVDKVTLENLMLFYGKGEK